ncbi:Acyltransferase family protein associated with ethylmalonyl-CoA pathway [hydrothermal vent metagenome]|uniref:Acyltransferase family protein associated with ethylmalonyl-CoA pathway n=1 Tax=hydrothermal vent metagenome TaxID=652676 RepID=A0A3B0XWY8_9ZZZZ
MPDMDNTITLPLWLAVLLALFSLALLLDRVLIPSVRWYLRRRINRVINEVNTRLDIEVRPFQLTRRQILIDQLSLDEKVVSAINDLAREKDMPREVAQAKANAYAREIVPSFNAYVYFRVGYWIAKRIARLIYRVRVGFHDADRLASVNPDATVVFVMNHRSNMDYLLVSFLAAEKTALSYAVGEWAQIWPLQTLIRAMGAFFVRRGTGNALYRRVLESYVQMATRAGVCQAVFPEGGLTRDGAMREPKLGFLDYMLRNYHPETDREIVFVPIGINYDRVVEDRSLVRRLDQEAEKRSAGFVVKTTVKFIFKQLMLSRRERWRHFGYASVNFGEPLSVRDWCHDQGVEFSRLEQEPRFEQVGRLANTLMERIADVVPVLPVPLLASIVLEHRDDWESELAIKTYALEKIDRLRELGAPIRIASCACEGVLTNALTTLRARKMLEQRDGLLRAVPEAEDMLSYYANSINRWNQPTDPAADH